MTPFRWMRAAWAELGVTETPGPASTPRVLTYHQATTLRATRDDVPWCSAFVCWVLGQAGLPHTQSAAARSYQVWGSPTALRYGAVVVLRRGANPAQGHVGFYVDGDRETVLLLGGNQRDTVTVQAFPASRVLAVRWPVA